LSKNIIISSQFLLASVFLLFSILVVTALNTQGLNVILEKMEGKSLNYTFLIEQDEDGIYIKKSS